MTGNIGRLPLLAFLIGMLVSSCAEGSAEWAGTVRDPAPAVAVEFDGTGGDEPFEFLAQPGHVLLVYFGFTSCPDVCPTTLADVAAARDQLEQTGDQVDLVMITVDPDRDSEVALSAYVGGFVPGSTALRTDDDAVLRETAEAFGVYYEVSTLDDGTVEVAHTGSLFAVDDAGRIVVSWPFGTPIDDLVNDLELLLERA